MADKALTTDQRMKFLSLFGKTADERGQIYFDSINSEVDGFIGAIKDQPGQDLFERARPQVLLYLGLVHEIAYLSCLIIDMLESPWPQFVQKAVLDEPKDRLARQIRWAQEERQRLENRAMALWDTLSL